MRPGHSSIRRMSATADLSRPLSDAEIVELDEILAAIPEAHDPLDVVMLDGYLAGVLLQPEAVQPALWVPFIFDAEGAEVASLTAERRRRAVDLTMRRHGELAACLAGREPFDPIVFDLDDENGRAPTENEKIAVLGPWAHGFMTALTEFGGLLERCEKNEDATSALYGVLRHLPLDPGMADEESIRSREQIDRDVPLADLDEAIDELVGCVLETAEIVKPNKPSTRAAPKIGRNDPCHCGSGRKYKLCHGRDEH